MKYEKTSVIVTFSLINVFTSLSNNVNEKMNVIFIAVDDLRPELNCFGADYMVTPNIDFLAKNGVIFKRAYCQQAVSAPSRNSVLTGLRPDAIGIYDLSTFFRKKVPNVITLPQHFKNSGYRTESVGKIFHLSHGNSDDSLSWSIPRLNPNLLLGKLKKVSYNDTTGLESDYPKVSGRLLPFYSSKAPENDMTDARTVTVAIERIKALKETPFFLAIGFVKPHLPFVAPEKYWNLYDDNDIQIPLREKPKNCSEYCFADFGELRKYHGIPSTGLLDDSLSRNLIHGYRASISFIDHQIGRLIEALRSNDLLDKTVIVLWGDHGWKLGDFGSWCKHSNIEMDVKSPLIISSPKHKKSISVNSIVEFIDIYPTLCDLAGLEKPAHLQGISLVPLLNNPESETKEYALSQYPREKEKVMGYSICSKEYRYTRWVNFDSPSKEIIEEELYKLDDLSNNIVKDSTYKSVLVSLSDALNNITKVCR